MRPQTRAERLWLDSTNAPLKLGSAIGGIGIATLVSVFNDYDPMFFLLYTVPTAGVLAYAVWKANARRTHLRQLLGAALGAQGDAGADVATDRFPDIPVCVSQKWVYCAREKDVDVQPLDKMIWAYAEIIALRRRLQLVIWNRGGGANVLSVRKRYLAPALDRLRRAAPWLPVGYNAAMKETWNVDHRDFLALVDGCRDSRQPFDAPGRDMASPAPMRRGRSTPYKRSWIRERNGNARNSCGAGKGIH
ncbi:MAG: hypothetical protein EXQ89_02540 [Rhodospirillaceae bacterium]|nr:hypothetical protein [Rhodospirillaceae bacterium]